MNRFTLAFALGALVTPALLSAQSGIESDDFNAPVLNPRWRVLDPIGDVTIGLQGFGTSDAQLRFDIPGNVRHDLWRDAADAPRVLQSANDTDYRVEAKFETFPVARFQFQGISSQQADNHLVRAEFLSRGNGLYLFVAVINGSSAQAIYDELIDPTSQYLRVERTGDTWTVSYSSNAVDYTVGVTFDYALTISEVGLHAGNNGSPAPAFTTLCDYFFNLDAPILDEDGMQDVDPPVAVAGDNVSARPGDVVMLDGSQSSDNQTQTSDLVPAWTIVGQPVGSTAMLVGADTLTPSLALDLPGEYVVQLVVTDLAGLSSAPDTVTIASTNQAPVANAGSDDVVAVGTSLDLDGLGSFDPDGDDIDFDWDLVSAPAGSMATLVGADTATPSLTPDVAGDYVVSLVVRDAFAESGAATVTITATDDMSSPSQILRDLADALRHEPRWKFTFFLDKFLLRTQLRIAAWELDNGYDCWARARLNHLVRRVDGCALRGMPDTSCWWRTRDWIDHCPLQLSVYGTLQNVLDLLDD
jgi:hypothetical protein